MRNTNELDLWFAVAPVANGAYVYGAYPMYRYKKDGVPGRYTSIGQGESGGWTIEYIKEFIRVSTGASILAEVDSWPIGKTRFPSQI